jgi:D-glycero-beta-D-manno-heptose 1-phosphate adenylyltransferase
VAVNTDESMRVIKPDRRPVNKDYERLELIAAFAPVDYVVPLRETTPERLIQLYRPDIHTKGTDYTLDRIPERALVESYGGRVELVGDPKDHSTTEMLRALRGGGT